jgi:integrase
MNKKQIKKILKDFLEFDQQYQLDEDAYDYFADQIIGLDNQLTWWKKELGSYTLADVTSALIAEKRDQLLSEKTSRGTLRQPATVVRYMAALSHAFTVTIKEWEWLERNPVQRVTRPKEPRGRVRFLNDDERKRLLKACEESSNQNLYLIVLLAISTGMRQQEILGMKWQNLDLERQCIFLHDTKNGERRQIPLTGPAYTLLRDRAATTTNKQGLIFQGTEPDTQVNIRTTWLSAIAAANIEDFLFHDLRHTAASYLAMNGATPSELSEILGHKTFQMIKRYTHLCDKHTHSVVARMTANMFQESTEEQGKD